MIAAAALKVLVVDDQKSIRALLREGLRQLGVNVIMEAENGEDALRIMVTRPVNLVITDFNMPKVDGLELLRAIRSHPPIKGVAVIMVTGSADRELVQKAVKHGVNNLMAKPFTMADLKGKLDAVFGSVT